MHGHSYRLEVTVAGPLQADGSAAGMVMDFETLDGIVRQRAVDRLDHQILNDLIENPTAERVTLWIWEQLADPLPGLVELVLWETRNSCAILRREDVARDAATR
jgi:6-pyruvoyltetrahydropterin/6-carboxytetrahydropterin synthase